MSLYRETVFRCASTLPLAQAINRLNPNGFEPLETDATEGVEYFMLGYSPDEKHDINQAMAHPSTPPFSVRNWAIKKLLWIPVAWCEEVPHDDCD